MTYYVQSHDELLYSVINKDTGRTHSVWDAEDEAVTAALYLNRLVDTEQHDGRDQLLALDTAFTLAALAEVKHDR